MKTPLGTENVRPDSNETEKIHITLQNSVEIDESDNNTKP